MTNNRETAQLLEKVAAVFRVKEGDSFRVKAYNNAAIAIDNLSEPLEQLWQQGRLDSVPGLGKSLIKYLDQYFATGHVRHFDSQLKKVPAGMFALMDIRGIGPITAYKIAKKFYLNNYRTALSDLAQLIKDGRLAHLKSFTEKKIKNISNFLKAKPISSDRLLLSDALIVAEDYVDYLKTFPDIIDAEPLGSLRRRLPTVGDIDLAICTRHPEQSLAHATAFSQVKEVLIKGDKLCRVKLNNGLEIDIKVSEPRNWGSLLQHYTGSKMHNIRLRTLAKENGFSLSEYGITKNNKEHSFQSETAFYNFLNLQMIPPEIREDGGEIELAQNRQIPTLVDLKDIRGDLHIHSNFDFPISHDHGSSPLKNILQQAQLLGYEYLGIVDHNPKVTDLTEKQRERILRSRKQFLLQAFRAYENSVKNCAIKLLIGLEVDIRPDGELALSDSSLSLLDYAIVSIHSSFEMSCEENTQRIIRGLSHPKAKILGHPTGRIINKREPISADWEKIFAFCADNKKIVEINSFPDRADLPDDLIKQAIQAGVKLIINTDSHNAIHLPYMKFGVWNARKGYATKKNIVNTLSWVKLRTLLK